MSDGREMGEMERMAIDGECNMMDRRLARAIDDLGADVANLQERINKGGGASGEASPNDATSVLSDAASVEVIKASLVAALTKERDEAVAERDQLREQINNADRKYDALSAEETLMAECEHEYFWYPAANEEGWECCRCGHKPGEPPGFDPRLDRDLLEIKVESILHDLHESYLIDVSNSDEGEGLVGAVMRRCRDLDRNDQYTICRELFAAHHSHGEYWHEIAEGVLSGEDKRQRCHCGALATTHTERSNFCSEHSGGLLEAARG